jgi:hypothetical protein
LEKVGEEFSDAAFEAERSRRAIAAVEHVAGSAVGSIAAMSKAQQAASDTQRLVEDITAANALLECAEDKLRQAVLAELECG